jgi:RHS repeat-associated protein
MVALNKTYRETLTPDRSAKDSGHRYYSPEISRWLSRDPVEERGGVNLYTAVANGIPNKVDLIGLLEFRVQVQAGCNGYGWVSYNRRHCDPPCWLWMPESRGEVAVECAANIFHGGWMCDTQTDIEIQARNVCCRKFRVLCKWRYWGRGFGHNRARLGLEGVNLGEPIDMLDQKPWAAEEASPNQVFEIGPISWHGLQVAEMDIAEDWQRLLWVQPRAGMWTHTFWGDGAYINESAVAECKAKDIGPCDWQGLAGFEASLGLVLGN